MAANDTPAVKLNNNPVDDPVSAEPYRWEDCTVKINITLLPQENGEAHERVALLSARTHADAPLIRRMPAYQVLPLPPALTQLLADLQAQLPVRAAHYEERQARAAARVTPAASGTPAPGKRNKTGRSLTATTASGAGEPAGWSGDLFSAPPQTDKPEGDTTPGADPSPVTPATSATWRQQDGIKAPPTQMSFL